MLGVKNNGRDQGFGRKKDLGCDGSGTQAEHGLSCPRACSGTLGLEVFFKR